MSTSMIRALSSDDVDNTETAPLLTMPEPLTDRQFDFAVDSLSRSSTPSIDIVQFCLPVFVAYETQGQVELRVMRIRSGKSQDRGVSFSYETVESSAKAGVVYEHVSGKVDMAPGEAETTILVPIKQSSAWNATLEFKVLLVDPTGCQLGDALKQTRVKVIDTTPFPDESFLTDVSQGTKQIDGLRLYPAFVWYLMWLDGILWRTAVMVSIDILKNIYHYMMMVSTVYMVDRIFNTDYPASKLLVPGYRLGSAYVISFLTVTPMLLFFLLDRIAIRLDVKGLLRASVTRSLFRKFMNYSKSSADQFPVPDMVIALTQDVSDVTFSYMKLLEMIRLLGEVGVSIFFTLQHNPSVWWAAVAVPAVMLLWGACRTKGFIAQSEQTSTKEEECAYFSSEVLTKLPLVSSYAQRPHMNDFFAEKVEELRVAKITERILILTNMVVPKLMGPALVAIYTATGADQVLNNQLNLGVFLATIKIFTSICSAFYEAFDIAMDVLHTVPTLKEMFFLFNMPTDVADLGKSNEARMKITASRRAAVPYHESIPEVDRLKIEVLNVDYRHTNGSLQFKALNFTCEQGKLCVVSSIPGSGRQTLLQLLVHTKFPTKGSVFVPSHLRIVHVSREVFLMNLSVWENLNFGTYDNQKIEHHSYRVAQILQHFGMEKVERFCRDELDGVQDREAAITSESAAQFGITLQALREGEQSEIHIARAFIMNPELLVMHRPFCHYHNGRDWRHLCSAMTGHRDNRGLFMPLETAYQRRPRTIFFSADSMSQHTIADWCWVIPDTVGGVCKQFAATERQNTAQRPLLVTEISQPREEEDIRQFACQSADVTSNIERKKTEPRSAHVCEEENIGQPAWQATDVASTIDRSRQPAGQPKDATSNISAEWKGSTENSHSIQSRGFDAKSGTSSGWNQRVPERGEFRDLAREAKDVETFKDMKEELKIKHQKLEAARLNRNSEPGYFLDRSGPRWRFC